MTDTVLVFLGAAFLMLGGCEATRQSVNRSFWRQNRSIIGVGYIVPNSPYAAYYVGIDNWRTGLIYSMRDIRKKINDPANRAADTAYAEHFGKFDRFVESLDKTTPLVDLQHVFAQRLKDLGYRVKEMKDPVKGRRIDDANSWDFTDAATREHVDTLLVISAGDIGVTDSDHNGEHWLATYCFDGFMSRMSFGRMRKNTFRAGLWKWYTPIENCESPVDMNWFDPSHFDSDKKAMDQAMDRGKKYLLESFFKKAPMPSK